MISRRAVTIAHGKAFSLWGVSAWIPWSSHGMTEVRKGKSGLPFHSRQCIAKPGIQQCCRQYRLPRAAMNCHPGLTQRGKTGIQYAVSSEANNRKFSWILDLCLCRDDKSPCRDHCSRQGFFSLRRNGMVPMVEPWEDEVEARSGLNVQASCSSAIPSKQKPGRNLPGFQDPVYASLA
ncbi:hypothetical protein ACSSV1_004325 [Labrenzia sp. MBR-25]